MNKGQPSVSDRRTDIRARLWRTAALLGLLTIAAAFWFLSRPIPSCGGPPLASAMLDLEMATERAQFAAVLDCLPRLAELDTQNIVDLLLFMWAYTGMLTAFMLAVGVGRGVAMGLAVLMLGGDFIETAILRRIAAGGPQLDAATVVVLAAAARVKFAAIGLAMITIALKLWRTGGRSARLIAVIVALGGIASLAIIPPPFREPASQVVAAGWLAIAAYAAINALRPRQPAPSSADA